ncbi:hypothetical protein HKBW3S44_00471 [Candidatus Hakubella thermalkaliphila]|uniref:Uncharacterized protein n=4 Tax=Candidatus Hakubella thermalkaliphila TaxID=2754717 RepID=A0A6V8P9I6_9ACTN|nr:hypothetical protein [Candidatus Hakubella thermalkaliphila]GFP29332.1 hypothetical protein HKBW3S34_00252 [Candidatus Hakubella thermalkaliphila]GFP36790.1 hypothetical protein HKBW3S44_00471 [Candidatus Hakubella thermalkaliphila]
MMKPRTILYAFLLLVAVGAGAIAIWHFDLGPPWGITKEDLAREGGRSWVLMYKMYECQEGAEWAEDDPRRIAERKISQINDQFFQAYEEGDFPSPKEEYWFWVKTNRIREKALAQVMDEKEFRALKGKYTLEEAYGSVERANAIMEECEREIEKFRKLSLARDQMRGLLVEALDPVYVELYEPRGDRAYVRLQGRLVSDGGAMPNVGFRYAPSGTEVYKTRWLGPRGAGATFEYSLTLPRGSWSWLAIAKHAALALRRRKYSPEPGT